MKTLRHVTFYFILLSLLCSITTLSESAPGGTCEVGDIIQPGESCTYPGTNDELSVDAAGRVHFLFFTAGGNLNINGTINGRHYHLVTEHSGGGGRRIIELAGDTLPPPPTAPQIVDIPDVNLRAAIAEALNKAPGDAITRADMETLVELRATSSEITDLRGIEFAINLERLYVYYNSISDISPLSSLTNLTYLDILGNSISDISPLSSLTNLTVLSLSDNDISDISPLSSLTNLTGLYLWGNDISDIFPLITLANLEGLYLSNNNISDISPLSSLTNLTSLNLWGNDISDIFPLITLANLRSLYLWRNTITDISSLSSLTNLTLLSLHNNSISDIFPLITLTNLRSLYVQYNNISDVETLERLMAQGTIVYFRGNPAFETPGPKIEDGWVWLIVPAANVFSGSDAAASGRDFLSEASGGAVTEADVAINGARAGTRVGDSVWTAARLDATDPNNLNIIAGDHNAYPVDLGEVPIHSETSQELGDNGWTADGLDATEIDKRTALMPDATLESHIDSPVAYGVVPIHSETPQQTRVYIGAGPVKVWVNGTLVHRDTNSRLVSDYETAVPVTLNAGDNVLFIAAYRPYPWTSRWGAFFGFQDGTGYTIGAPGPSAGNLDVNADGQVNVVDLAIVALFYGTQVPAGLSLPADVNTDGIVNLSDLIAVTEGIDAAGNAGRLAADDVGVVLEAVAEQVNVIEGVAGAPAHFSTSQQTRFSGIAHQNVAAAFADVKHLANADDRLGKWVPMLQEILHRLTEMREVPDTTALLPNYPNPFNPETWIPYHLSKETEVTLTIYDVRGVLVRALTLGHQAAGVYESRARAAYWDGRNAVGEPVASGLYFYTLTAGDFSATRKMLIRK